MNFDCTGIDPLLDKALAAIGARSAFSGFQESGSSRIHGTEKPAAGKAAYEAHLGREFRLDETESDFVTGEEVSPFTGHALKIRYAAPDPDRQFAAASAAMRPWAAASVQQRIKLCVDMLREVDAHGFEMAHATMHTAGQSFPMAYAGSGANALDRGLEAVAWAGLMMTALPMEAHWQKQIGAGDPIRLHKRWRLIPRGPAVVFCCASFPTWNGYPAMMANLACGNPVLVKPHPTAVLPMAIAVRIMREVLEAAGFDRGLIQLVVDSSSNPLGKELVEHEHAAIVDFTGSARFGSWVEQHAGNRPCYTETSGINTVILDGADDPEAALDSVVNTLCLFSAQMCTSPQTIYVPETGMTGSNGHHLGPEQVEAELIKRIDALAANPKRAASVMGCIQSSTTLDMIAQWTVAAESGKYRLLRRSGEYNHPEADTARTATPLVLGLNLEDGIAPREEVFGPVAFVVRVPDREQAVQHAAESARRYGALTSYLYSTDEDYLQSATEAFAWSGAALTCNLIGHMPLNFSAAYSDLHVSGLNPAGNATLAEPSFIAGRFRYAQVRWPQANGEQ